MTTHLLTDAWLVKHLDKIIGPTLTALTGNMSDRSRIGKVADNKDRLTPEERSRLELAFNLLKDVTRAEDEGTARNWFIGANTGPDLVSPYEAIRDGHFTDARLSAMDMCNPEDMGK